MAFEPTEYRTGYYPTLLQGLISLATYTTRSIPSSVYGTSALSPLYAILSPTTNCDGYLVGWLKKEAVR